MDVREKKGDVGGWIDAGKRSGKRKEKKLEGKGKWAPLPPHFMSEKARDRETEQHRSCTSLLLLRETEQERIKSSVACARIPLQSTEIVERTREKGTGARDRTLGEEGSQQAAWRRLRLGGKGGQR